MSQDATTTTTTTIDYSPSMLATTGSRLDVAGAAAEPYFYGLSATAWLKIAVVSVLMIATFRFNLLRLWLKTNPINGEPNWRHAICVPLIGLYYLYVHRDDLLKLSTHTAWSGLGILVTGIFLFAYGIYPGQNDFVKDFGMVVTLFGVVALLCGWPVMRIAWFPIAFLVCAIPWPELVYSYVASPLQHLAASVAVGTLRLCNVESLNSGTKIIINAKGNTWRTLNVAEACAGLRSLMTFISVAAAIAFLSARPLWQKTVITLSAIPIAIFCNVMRVTGQGLLDHYWSQEISEGFAHQFVGIVMLVPGFLLIVLVGWLLDQIFIEVVDEREERRKKALKRPATAAVDWTLPRGSLADDRPMPAGAGAAAAAPAGSPMKVPPPAAPRALPAARMASPQPSKPAAAAVAKPAAATKPATATAPKVTSRPPASAAPAAKPAATAQPAIKKPVGVAKPASPAAAGAAAPVRKPAPAAQAQAARPPVAPLKQEGK